MRRLTSIVLAGLATLALLGACGGDEAADGPYVDLLRFIPDTPEARGGIVLGDLTRVRDLAGMDEPTAHPSRDEELIYIEALFVPAPTGVLGPWAWTEMRYFGMSLDYTLDASEATRTALGFSLPDMDRYAYLQPPGGGAQPGSVPLSVMQGRFTTEVAAETIEACAPCAPVEAGERSGWTTYTWMHTDALAPAGAALHVALRDGYLARGLSPADLDAMLDAREEGGSLADDAALRRLAEHLDDLGVASAVLSAHTPDLAWGAEVWAAIEGMAQPGNQDGLLPDQGIAVLRPYVAAAAGAGVEDGEVVYYHLLSHDDEELATENVGRITERFEALIDRGLTTLPDGTTLFDRYEIQQAGPIVIVRFPDSRMGLYIQSHLFLHE